MRPQQPEALLKQIHFCCGVHWMLFRSANLLPAWGTAPAGDMMEAPLKGWKYTALGKRASINVPFTLEHSDSECVCVYDVKLNWQWVWLEVWRGNCTVSQPFNLVLKWLVSSQRPFGLMLRNCLRPCCLVLQPEIELRADSNTEILPAPGAHRDKLPNKNLLHYLIQPSCLHKSTFSWVENTKIKSHIEH